MPAPAVGVIGVSARARALYLEYFLPNGIIGIGQYSSIQTEYIVLLPCNPGEAEKRLNRGKTGRVTLPVAALAFPRGKAYAMCGGTSRIFGETARPGGTTMAESDEKRCPHCAEVIKKEARVCRYCGRDLTPKPYRPPIWSNRPPPYWKEEVKKRAWNAVVAYHAIPTVIGLAIGLAIYLPGAISGCRSSQEFSIFYSLDKRIGRGEELSDVELKEYFERLSDRYGYRIATENSRVNEDIKAWVKKIDDETHTVWINSENWDNQFFRHLSFIQNMAMYFFQKDPQTIPYCTIRSIEDDSVVATTRGMVNWEILRKKHQVQKGD